jgi:hypothetical protein
MAWGDQGLDKLTYKWAFLAVAIVMWFLANSFLIDVDLGVLLLAGIVGMRAYNAGLSKGASWLIGIFFGLCFVTFLNYRKYGEYLQISLSLSLLIFVACALAKERRLLE